jgi:hypothetical protein
MVLPHKAFAHRLLVNSALIWVGVRGFLFLVAQLWTGWQLACGVVALTTVLAVLDIRRRNEHLWLENLGVARLMVAGIAFAPPVVLELARALVSQL